MKAVLVAAAERGAAKCAATGGRRRGRQRGRRVRQKQTYHRAESGSSPLSVGGRKSCEAGVQPRGSKSVNARTVPAAKRRCHTHSACQPASQASKWQARMCSKQPIVGQKAYPPRSTSMEGRVLRITMPSQYGQQQRRSSSPLPKGANRSPVPLRQQSHNEDNRVRRPLGRRVVWSSGPPSSSRKTPRFRSVVRSRSAPNLGRAMGRSGDS